VEGSIAEMRASAEGVGLRVLEVRIQWKLEGRPVRINYVLYKPGR
jgi:hypothetical protein